MTYRTYTQNLTRTVSRFATLIVVLAAWPALSGAEEITTLAPPAPPVVDTPPPPPVPATTDRSVAQATFVQPQAAAQPQSTYSYGDPYGFTAWLNGVRGQYGLGAVGFDSNLSGWAQVNNGQQNARGLGHHVMGPARRQNSGMGGDMATVCAMWMASPAHQAALLDPTITAIGIAASGSFWTFNAY